MAEEPARYKDTERNKLINQAVRDLEIIINRHDPEIDVPIADGVWNCLDKLCLEIETRELERHDIPGGDA